MKITINNKNYETVYFPFFRMYEKETYSCYGLRYPSGMIEEFIVYNDSNYMSELKKHLEFMVREYMLEDDDMLTPKAKELKEDVCRLFNYKR